MGRRISGLQTVIALSILALGGFSWQLEAGFEAPSLEILKLPYAFSTWQVLVDIIGREDASKLSGPGAGLELEPVQGASGPWIIWTTVDEEIAEVGVLQLGSGELAEETMKTVQILLNSDYSFTFQSSSIGELLLGESALLAE